MRTKTKEEQELFEQLRPFFAWSSAQAALLLAGKPYETESKEGWSIFGPFRLRRRGKKKIN